MLKIKNYLLKLSLRYILLNQSIILFLVIFINLIELSSVLDNENSNLKNFIYLTLLKIPTILNETSPFVIIISTAFLFRYLINNNELISMRNVGFSIFDIFQPITIGILSYGLFILIFLNPLTGMFEIKYEEFLKHKNEKMYSINFSENSLWIKNKSRNEGMIYINIENFDIQEMYAENILILSINKENELYRASNGKILDKNFNLNEVHHFNLKNDNYEYKDKLLLGLNFTKENVLSSVINYKNIPYYNYFSHIRTLKKFNLYSSEISLFYLSEILKPFFMILLSFVVMSFSAKYKRNENFFKILFYSLAFGFVFYVYKELISKYTLSLNINFIFSYILIFILPFMIGLYKVIQIEND